MSENLKFEIINDGEVLRVSAENLEDFAQYIKYHEDDMLTAYKPNSDMAFMQLTEQYQGNGWLVTTADKLGHMSECLLISNEYEIKEGSGEWIEYTADKFWTNIHDYQIVNPLDQILETGYYDFYLAE